MEKVQFRRKDITTNQQLHTFASALVARMKLATRMGLQYGGSRDIYNALGYPKDIIKFDDYFKRYTRQDIAKAIIDRPVTSTWQGPLDLIESDKSKDTDFEISWHDLNKKLSLKSILTRVDKLTRIGRYSVLLLGMDDVKNTDGFVRPVQPGVRKLMYLRPFSEETAEISKFEDSPSSERYGLPLIYTLRVENVSNKSNMDVKVHHSRVIHIIDGALESEVYGTPVLESLFNRLMDLDKIVGGDAEMFWRNARPGYEGKVDPEYQMTEAMKEELKDQIDEYENDLRRFLINEGVNIQALTQQLADPLHHVDIQMQMISAVTGIPKRILVGSERGELSSAQDTSEWKDYVQARRENYAEPNIIRPLVARLIQYGILPKPASDDYLVKWNDLYSLSEKERVEIGKARSNSLREYTYSPMAQALIPPKAFYEYFLGLTQEEITLVLEMLGETISEEELNAKILELIDGEIRDKTMPPNPPPREETK